MGEEELEEGERVVTMALDTHRLYVATSRNRLIVKLVDQPNDQSEKQSTSSYFIISILIAIIAIAIAYLVTSLQR